MGPDKTLFAALLFLLPFGVPSSLANERSVFLGVGIVAENISRYSSDPTDSTVSLLGRDYIQLSLRAHWGSFVPSISFTPLGIGSPEGGERTRLLSLRTCWNFPLGIFDFSIGPGLMHRMVSSSGGTVTLNNGNSQQDFYVPSTSASQNLLFLSLGIGRTFTDLRVDLDAWIFNLAGAGRSIDGVITVGYGIN